MCRATLMPADGRWSADGTTASSGWEAPERPVVAQHPPGAIRVERSGVRIGTASQPVLLGTVQPPGKKQMDAAAWALLHVVLEAGEQFSAENRSGVRQPRRP